LAGIAALVLAVAAVALSVVYAGRIWHEFTNPGNTQVVNTKTRLGSAKSDRWVWWQEAWHAFTQHPGGGTGAGTFQQTNQMLRHAPVVVDEPHNVPLQFLTETGIVGLLVYLAAAAGALWGAWRARREPAGLALGLGVAAFFAHGVVDKDWNYVATCGPLLLLAGCLVARPRPERARRPVLALAAAAVALAHRVLAGGSVACEPAARVGIDRGAGEARALVRSAVSRRAARARRSRGCNREPQ